jgi:probable HAF family extracellular repeat protein
MSFVHRRTVIVLAMIDAAILLTSGSARAQYVFTPVTGGFPLGLNDAGDMVGTANPHGVLWREGEPTTFDVPGATVTVGYAINKHGHIVGTYQDATGYHSFLRTKGIYTTLDVPGAMETRAAFGINDSGQIVGLYYDANSHSHAFLLSGGVYTTVDVPDAVSTTAFGINAAGDIVGAFADQKGTHGFLLSQGVYTEFDAPGAVYGTALKGINRKGEIIGYYTGASRSAHSFVWRNGVYTLFEQPPDALYSPSLSAINDRGQIVGSYTNTNDRVRFFLATPTH